MAAWIPRDSRWSDVTGAHVASWLSVPPQVVLAGHKLGCGRHIYASEFLRPSLEFVMYWTNIQNPDKGNPSLSECPDTRHSGQLLTAVALVFKFSNKIKHDPFSVGHIVVIAFFKVNLKK